jgi:hypothetical protein
MNGKTITTRELASRLRVPDETARALLADEARRGRVVEPQPGHWALTDAGRRAVEPFLVATTKIVDL